MSSEERIVRPYRGLDRIQHGLRHVFLQVGATHIEAGKSATFSPGTYLTSRVVAHLARDEEEFEKVRADLAEGVTEAGVEADDAVVQILLTTPRLKRTSVAFAQSLTELDALPMAIKLADPDTRPDELAAPFGGCRVDVMIRLNNQLKPQALRPWRLGTWLAHARFGLSTDLGDVGFTPMPLTPAIRAQFGLPEGALRYVHIEDPFGASADEVLRLYLDEQLFASLMVKPNSPAAVFFQRQLFLDAVTAIVYASAAVDGLTTLSDIEGSVLDRLIGRLAGSDGKSPSKLAERKSDFFDEAINSPRRFLARVEDLIGDLRGNLESVLSGGE